MDDSMVNSVFDDPASSDFAPELVVKPKPKAAAKAAPKKAAAPKATTKKTQTTLKTKAKPAASKKRAKLDTEDEDSAPERDSAHDDTLLSATPPSAKKQKKAPAPKKAGTKPLQERENEALGFDGVADSKPKKGSTDQYQKLTQLEHIIKRPDTYIGSVERSEKQMWVYNTELDSMEMREVSFVPGLYKIFDEILVNAADNKIRDKNMDTVKVTVDRQKGGISVLNNGRGIPIEIHEKEGIYIPEMIFGHLLTSSNYDDEEQKVTGGRNGYGAKLCNVFSTEFILETADSKSKKKYKQTWTDNMTNMGQATIVANKGDDFTKITFTPDFKKFGMTGMDDDFEALVKRRVYDLAGTIKGVKVWLNGEKVKITNFKKYMEMYTKAIKKERGEEAVNDTSDIITDSDASHPRWEIGFAVSDGTFQQVSFVNSIATTSGGSHVNYIADQVCTKLLDIVKKKNKGGAVLKLAQIRNHIFLFINCQIVNPAFTSQTKEQLTTKHSQFGSKCVVSDEFLKKIAKTEVVQNILHFAEQKADQILKKSDGARRSRMDNPKLTDANRAGTKDGYQCTLILTEGDSAKGLAMAGRSIVGPDLFGVFPLRGKLLNVRDASVDQISKNAEIQNIKNILGLKHKTTYTDCKSLRYGHIMIMTDQDHDGSHIKGLLINFLQVTYPSLLKLTEFLIEFITPIVKVFKGDPKQPSKSRSFFTMPEYEQWKEEHKTERGWEVKYYKGLGTSSTEDGQIYFRDLDKHLKHFHTMQDHEPALIELAFSKKKADERKEWLRQFKVGTYLDHTIREITYTDFINKELILFSMADNLRSIPSVVDGFKPGQRKVLYACLKRNIRKDMKVAELAGYAGSITAYHHGEVSLQQTIVGLAQTFVGSNNVNCLEPSGNFGSRLQGGSDSASARYIFTRLSPFARKVFHPLDEPILKYNIDEGDTIEPEMYVPVVPMILINGADGIGTGWSSSIPNYSPEDIVENLKLMMDGKPPNPMTPWFRDFKGTITPMGPDRYKFSGIISQTGDNEVEITELPIRLWTQDFKEKLVEIMKAEKTPSWIKDYDDYNTHKNVHFVVRLEDKYMKVALEEGLEEKFKLTKSIATSNLVAFDPEGRITKYAGVEDILKEFYAVRIKFYEKRKAWQLQEYHRELEKLTNQARFITMIIEGQLIVSKKKKKDLVTELKQKGFKPFPKIVDASKGGETEPVVANEELEDGDENVETEANAYDYLLGMAIWSLTKERVEKLQRQIGDKEIEVDTLIKLSKEDLWKRDLEDFINEWRVQLEQEEKRQKKITNLDRRASSKLKTQIRPAGKKRRANDDTPSDSDFGGAKVKKIVKNVQPKGGLLSYLAPQPKTIQPKPKLKNQTSIVDSFATPALTLEVSREDPKPEVEVKVKMQDAMSLDGAQDHGSDVPIKPKGRGRPKGAPSKAAAPVKANAKSKKVQPVIDDSDEEPAHPVVAQRAAKLKTKKVVSDDSDDEMAPAVEVVKKTVAKATKAMSDGSDDEMFAPGAAKSRAPRAAARKPVKYNTLTDSDSDNGDDLLFDVGKMVKGIGLDASVDPPTASRPLFSTTASLSRPGSSGGFGSRKSASRGNGAMFDDNDDDETDYTRLAPAMPKTAKSTILSDDEENSLDLAPAVPAPKAGKSTFVIPAAEPFSKAKAPAKAAATKKVPVKKAPAIKEKVKEPALEKKIALSPAAKAYAAKQSRAAAAPAPTKASKSKAFSLDSEEDDDDDMEIDEVGKMANDILSDDDEDDDEEDDDIVPAGRSAIGAASNGAGGRPARRAAAEATKKTWVLDDDDEDEEDEEDEEPSGDFDSDGSD